MVTSSMVTSSIVSSSTVIGTRGRSSRALHSLSSSLRSTLDCPAVCPLRATSKISSSCSSSSLSSSLGPRCAGVCSKADAVALAVRARRRSSQPRGSLSTHLSRRCPQRPGQARQQPSALGRRERPSGARSRQSARMPLLAPRPSPLAPRPSPLGVNHGAPVPRLCAALALVSSGASPNMPNSEGTCALSCLAPPSETKDANTVTRELRSSMLARIQQPLPWLRALRRPRPRPTRLVSLMPRPSLPPLTIESYRMADSPTYLLTCFLACVPA